MNRTGVTGSRPMSGVLVLRISLAALAAMGCLIGAVLAYRYALRPTDWGVFIEGDGSTIITRYSGPWLGAAAGLALLAGLLVVSLTTDSVRLHRLRRIGT